MKIAFELYLLKCDVSVMYSGRHLEMKKENLHDYNSKSQKNILAYPSIFVGNIFGRFHLSSRNKFRND